MSDWASSWGNDYYEHMFKLQDKAGLTFKEAMTVLSPPVYKKALAKEWGVTDEAVMNLHRRGWAKIRSFSKGDEALENELVPVRFWHIF